MKLSRQKINIENDLRNINNEMAKQILRVLENSGSAILKQEHLVIGSYSVPLEKVLILSDQMKRSLDVFKDNIQRIGSSKKMETGSQFYITDFGGSKTQFLELILSKLNIHINRNEIPFTNVIPIILNGSVDLKASILGEKIESRTARLLSTQLEYLNKDPDRNIDSHAFDHFMNLLVDFRKSKNAPEHINRIHSQLSEIETYSNLREISSKISTIRTELSNLPIIDEERLMNIVLDIMEYASKYGIIYLFLFDECDDWLAKIEEESIWDNIFIKRQFFFRKLYDHIQNLKLYQIYCLTPRIHEALRSEKSDNVPGIQRLSNDFIKTSSKGPYVEVREQGVYQGDEATEATLKWLVILEKAFQPADKIIYQRFLPKIIEKIENKLSRRKANSIIIASLRAFIELTEDIKNGHLHYESAKRNPSQYLTIGNIIQKTFVSYLNFLNMSFQSKHQDVGDGKKVDGRFIGQRGGNKELFAEIKSFKEPKSLNKDKAEQVINCAKMDKDVVFFCFSPNLDEDFVKNKFIEWRFAGLIPSTINLDRIIPIVIGDQTLLNCLVGFENVNPSQLEKKLEDFDTLLRLIKKDFHGKLLNLFPMEERITGEQTSSEEKSPKEEEITQNKFPIITISDGSYSKLLRNLKRLTDTTIRTAVEIITKLGTKSKVFSFRKTSTVKNDVKTPLLKKSFDDGLEFLKQNNILQEINEKIQFNWDIFDKADIKNDPKGLMIEIFKKILEVSK